jgi:hypothetical protein
MIIVLQPQILAPPPPKGLTLCPSLQTQAELEDQEYFTHVQSRALQLTHAQNFSHQLPLLMQLQLSGRQGPAHLQGV